MIRKRVERESESTPQAGLDEHVRLATLEMPALGTLRLNVPCSKLQLRVFPSE